MHNVNSDIRTSSTLSSNFYSSKKKFKEVIDKIFAKSWHLITDDTHFDEENYVYPFILMDNVLPEPLFLIKNKNGIECFSNVCTHRGNILVKSPGKIHKTINCNYHGRSFDTNGNFLFMPCTEGMENFPSNKDDLPKISTKQWNQFIFTSLEPKFIFEDLIVDVDARVGWMPVKDFVFRKDLSNEYLINANWTLYCDNYLEGFHIPFIHKDLNEVLNYEEYSVECFKYSNLQIGYAKDKDLCFDLPKSSIDYGKNIAAYYFWLFPNIMLNFYPWGLSVNIIKPLSNGKTKVNFYSYVWKEELLDKGAGADVNKIELEDQEVVTSVQMGVSSRLYKSGRFSPNMEQGVHHFHTIIKDFMYENDK